MMGNGFGMGIGGIFMWLFWIALILVVVWAIKARVVSDGRAEKEEKSALEILKERYARGEIDREEYEQKRRDLTG